jgi:hypothetical protein
MYKVMIATLLAAGLRAAPLPPHSFAAFAQQSSASERKETKAAGKTEKGTTWPKFWSDCNKRLKAAAK